MTVGFPAVIAALVAAIHAFVDPRDKPAGDQWSEERAKPLRLSAAA